MVPIWCPPGAHMVPTWNIWTVIRGLLDRERMTSHAAREDAVKVNFLPTLSFAVYNCCAVLCMQCYADAYFAYAQPLLCNAVSKLFLLFHLCKLLFHCFVMLGHCMVMLFHCYVMLFLCWYMQFHCYHLFYHYFLIRFHCIAMQFNFCVILFRCLSMKQNCFHGKKPHKKATKHQSKAMAQHNITASISYANANGGGQGKIRTKPAVFSDMG